MPLPHRIPLRRWRPCPRPSHPIVHGQVHALGSPALRRSGRSSLRFSGYASVAGHAPAASSSRRSATRVASLRVPGRDRGAAPLRVRRPCARRRSWGSSGPFAGLLPPAGGRGVVRPFRAHLPFPKCPAPTVFAGGSAVLMVFCPKDLTRGRWFKRDGLPGTFAAASGLQFPPAVRARRRLTRRRRPFLPWALGPLSGLRTLARGGEVATFRARRPPGPGLGSPSARGFGSALRVTNPVSSAGVSSARHRTSLQRVRAIDALRVPRRWVAEWLNAIGPGPGRRASCLRFVTVRAGGFDHLDQ